MYATDQTILDYLLPPGISGLIYDILVIFGYNGNCSATGRPQLRVSSRGRQATDRDSSTKRMRHWERLGAI